MTLGLVTLGRRNQIVQGPTSVVGELGEKPKQLMLAILSFMHISGNRGQIFADSHFGFFLCQFTHLEFSE